MLDLAKNCLESTYNDGPFKDIPQFVCGVATNGATEMLLRIKETAGCIGVPCVSVVTNDYDVSKVLSNLPALLASINGTLVKPLSNQLGTALDFPTTCFKAGLFSTEANRLPLKSFYESAVSNLGGYLQEYCGALAREQQSAFRTAFIIAACITVAIGLCCAVKNNFCGRASQALRACFQRAENNGYAAVPSAPLTAGAAASAVAAPVAEIEMPSCPNLNTLTAEQRGALLNSQSGPEV